MDPVLQGTAGFQSSPNRGGKFLRPLPDTIVIHYTATTTCASAIATLRNPQSQASAHFVIDRDGSIHQLVELDSVAWHAGASRHGTRVGLNKFSIGIEIVNAGRLHRTAAGEFLAWSGARIAPQEAIELVHRNEATPSWWHAYGETQIERVFDLCRHLVSGLAIKHILGHEEISPGRKSDPGPAFPLDRLRAQLLGTHRNVDDDAEDAAPLSMGVVTARMLNTRIAPSIVSPVASLPLRRGTTVTVADATAEWLRISSPVTAWVKRDYVELTANASSRASSAAARGDRSAWVRDKDQTGTASGS